MADTPLRDPRLCVQWRLGLALADVLVDLNELRLMVRHPEARALMLIDRPVTDLFDVVNGLLQELGE